MDTGNGRKATLIIALKESRTEGSTKRGDGGRGRGGRGCSNGVFVLVGVTHKALAGAAQLSYRYQTQQMRREECVYTCVDECLCVCVYARTGGNSVAQSNLI